MQTFKGSFFLYIKYNVQVYDVLKGFKFELFVVFGAYALRQLKNTYPVTMLSARQTLNSALGMMITNAMRINKWEAVF